MLIHATYTRHLFNVSLVLRKVVTETMGLAPEETSVTSEMLQVGGENERPKSSSSS